MKFSKFFLLMMLFFILPGLFFSSCTKKSDEVTQTIATESISDTNFAESDEDLLTVDYKEFYDELAPHGDWVQVSAEDLGLKMKGSGAGSRGESGMLIDDLLGIKTAYADDFNFGMFFVWRPSPNLAVSVIAGEPAPYVPYSNGSWMYTDAGWYFNAATPYEDVTCHYGRWVYSPALGWIWVPGRVWAPAWVEYRVTETYIAWTPIPPGVYIVNNFVAYPPFYDVHRYVIVEKRHFCEPMVYKYMYKEHKNKIKIKEWSRTDGIMVMNKTVINRGPDVVSIEKHYGRKIEQVKVNRVHDKGDAGFKDGVINSYNPAFTKVKSTSPDKKSFSKPDKVVSFDDVKKESGSEENDMKSKEKRKDKSQTDAVKQKSDQEKGSKDNYEGKDKGRDKSSYDKGRGDKKSSEDRNIKKNDRSKEQNDKGNKQDKRKDGSNDSREKDNNKGSKDNKSKGKK
jgi:hypothetical protein